jgi:plastocyanin
MLKTIARTATAAALIALPLAACGGGSSTASADISTAAVKVHALDALKFDKTEYSATAGDISIGYVDDGSLQHDLLVDGHGGFKLSVNGQGQAKLGTINLPPGTYTLYCDIPTHREAGMQATLTVTAPASSGSSSSTSAGSSASSGGGSSASSGSTSNSTSSLVTN